MDATIDRYHDYPDSTCTTVVVPITRLIILIRWSGSIVIASLADQERPSRSPLMITAMCKDLSNDKLMFALLGDVLRINLSRVEDKGS